MFMFECIKHGMVVGNICNQCLEEEKTEYIIKSIKEQKELILQLIEDVNDLKLKKKKNKRGIKTSFLFEKSTN